MFSVITDEITGLTDDELDDYAGFVIQWRLKMAGFVLPHEPKFDPEILLDLTKE